MARADRIDLARRTPTAALTHPRSVTPFPPAPQPPALHRRDVGAPVVVVVVEDLARRHSS
jgi:hypothetical protein